MSAPGPANLNTAKGILAKVGLKDGDYTIDQLDMGQHVNAMKAGTFDAGYTLEPNATIMHKLGIAKTVEAGVIANYVLGEPDADAYRRRLRASIGFINKRPDVAKRFAQAWAKADRLHQHQSGGSAQVSRQEYLDARQCRRYGADARLHHGQGHEPEAARLFAEIRRFRPADRRRAGKDRREASTSSRSNDRCAA